MFFFASREFIIFYINASHDEFIIFRRRIQRLSRILKIAAERAESSERGVSHANRSFLLVAP